MRRVCVLLLLGTFFWVTNCQERFPNVDYFGRGYNLVTANPHNVGGIEMSGFGLAIFSSGNYSNGKITSDGRFLVPNGWQIVRSVSCSYDATSVEINGMTSFAETLSKQSKINGDVKLPIAKITFSANDQYKEVQKNIYEEHTTVTESYVECAVYTGEIQPFELPDLDSGFVAGVARIPTQFNNSTKDFFFDIWFPAFGTSHIVASVMGGSYGQRAFIDNIKVSTMLSEGISIENAASASLLSQTGGRDTLTNQQKEEAATFDKNKKKSGQWSYGGRPSSTIQAWLDSVESEPNPVIVTSRSNIYLLTSSFFPNMTDIDLKLQALQNATDQYCSVLEEEHLIEQCTGHLTDLPPPTPIPPATTPIPLQPTCRVCTSCGGQYSSVVGQEQLTGDYGSWLAYGPGCSGGLRKVLKPGPFVCCSGPPTYTNTACRLCASQCGSSWPTEVGRRLDSHDYTAFSMYGPGCSNAYGTYSTKTEPVFCCRDYSQCRICAGSCGPNMEEVGAVLHNKDYGPWDMFSAQTCYPGSTSGYANYGVGPIPIWCCPVGT
mmetsp:Transcript_13623/g.20520  ORF Transcript_13623/g.20520 Transcript_13623/m.20520 type:complete len:547 (-) Transcript_13623:30-1670(-)